MSQIFNAIQQGPRIKILIEKYGIDVIKFVIERECQFVGDELTEKTVEKYRRQFEDEGWYRK
jgi:hypothetical protein